MSNLPAATIDNTVRALIAEQLGIELDDVKDNSNIITDLNADSLDVIELVISLEELFALEIPDHEAERLATPLQVIEYIQSKVVR